MDITRHLLATADAYCRHTGLSRARVATLALNDGKFFSRIEGGGSPTIRTYHRLMTWLREHWPVDEPWPGDLPTVAGVSSEAA